MTVTISLPEELTRFIEAKLSGGHYRDTSEIVGDALRLMARVERDNEAKLEALRQAIREGIESGPAEEIDFEAIKAEGRRRLAAAGE